MTKAYRALTVLMITASVGIGSVSIAPAYAQPGHSGGYHSDRDDRRHDSKPGDRRQHYDRNDRHDRRPPSRPQNRQTIRVVHSYDYNRPDPRYHGYYANRYYRGGYSNIIVNRSTRIYRGDNGRYYCRRSDGTTGLIIGGTLGAVIGNKLDQGQSGILGTLLGAGAGALLGQQIDRGDIRCR